MSQSVCLERKIQPCVYNCFLSFSSKTMISLKKTEVLSFGQADAGSQKNGKSSIGRSSSMARGKRMRNGRKEIMRLKPFENANAQEDRMLLVTQRKNASDSCAIQQRGKWQYAIKAAYWNWPALQVFGTNSRLETVPFMNIEYAQCYDNEWGT